MTFPASDANRLHPLGDTEGCNMPRIKKKSQRKPHGPAFTDLPDMCTLEQAGAYLQLARNTAYSLVARGVLPRVRYGRVIRVPKTALLKG